MSRRRSKQSQRNSPTISTSKIEAFMRFVSNNKLLTLMYSLFIPCLLFVVNFYVQAPNRRLDFEQKSRDVDFLLSEGKRIDAVYGAIIDIADAYVKADTAYFGIINQIKDKKIIPSNDEIRKAADVVSQSYTTIIINIDILKGTKLSDPRLSEYPSEFAQNAEALKTTVLESEDVFVSLIKGDTDAVLKSMQEHSSAWYQSNNTALELRTRAESFSEISMKVSSDEEIALSKATNDIKYFRIQEFLTKPAIIFLLSVIFYTIYRFNLFSKKKK